MIGRKKGLLTVKSTFRKGNKTYVVCDCSCGKEKTTRQDYFSKGGIRCCGCTRWNYHKPKLTNDFLKEIYEKDKRSLRHFNGTRIHNTWRSIRFTQKGKAAGSPDSWSDFFLFMEEVQEGYHPSLFLQRKDQKRPHSKHNSEWVGRDKLRSRNNLMLLDYKGQTYTVKELSDMFGVGVGAIKSRLTKGCTVEQAVNIKIPKRSRKVRSHSEMKDKERRAKASKMMSSYRHTDKVKGYNNDLDMDFMINEIFDNPCSYCGTLEKVGCDRLDNSKGHTKDNVVPACYECNTLRKDLFTFEEMKKIGEFLRSEIYGKRS